MLHQVFIWLCRKSLILKVPQSTILLGIVHFFTDGYKLFRLLLHHRVQRIDISFQCINPDLTCNVKSSQIIILLTDVFNRSN